ncbi:FkbM family methyltransferase [Polaribacter porphyrae]|uniref:Methyltransferase FkbM domain-containing protein n=1 Tax=Polaribacter porphyrae TaxID=1137780 RepID=A0A2S7WS42_9FLAO|nr:FkbM family methyltransferase [Polaribacter porphyrae]PQJ80410.1 hypothetical protein BTO18_15065 [Polaribacter porphyrae]
MKLIQVIRAVLNPLKLDLKIYPREDFRRRILLIKTNGINKILDVGANSGQYAQQIFDLGFSGKILSFEPVPSIYKKLLKNSSKKTNWEAFNFGLGNKDVELDINISENTYSTSLLKIMPNHVKSAPESKVVSTEKVIIKKLDTIFDEVVDDQDSVLLKIDVQGFEKNVLEGAENTLRKIKGIQIEMSIEELYQNETLFSEMLVYIESLGFSLHSLENGFYNSKTGKLLQVDGVFFRK